MPKGFAGQTGGQAAEKHQAAKQLNDSRIKTFAAWLLRVLFFKSS
jgi:hypothetical protein